MSDEAMIVNVPAVGEPEWQGEITDGKLDLVICGLLIPNQAFSKALARALKNAKKAGAK
jgi:hypothetical protein